MEKSGFYCIKCKSVPLIQIVPKVYDVKIFCCCKCSKKLINYEFFIKNYFTKNINYDKISNEPIYKEYKDTDDENLLDKKIDIRDIKKKYLQISDNIYKYLLEIKIKTIELLEKYIKDINQSYETNVKNNQKLDKIIDILFKNYEVNNKNISNIKNLIYNTNFNYGYLNEFSNKLKFNNDISIDSLIKYVKEFFSKTYILSGYNEGLYNTKNFFNHSSTVTCLVELAPNGMASCSKDSYINIYNLGNKKSLYKFHAHSNGVSWINKIYKNYIISCGEDSSIKIWPNPQLNYKANINYNGYYSVTFSEELNVIPIKILNLKFIILKFIFLNNNYIYMIGINKILLVKYELIIDEKNNENLLNVGLDIIKEINLENIFILDLLRLQNNNNQELIFHLCSNKIQLFSIKDFSVIYEHQEYNKNLSSNCLTQINKDDIIYSNGHYINIFNIKSFKIQFRYKNTKDITSLTKLKDNTLLICTSSGITRIETKHFEELSLVSMIYSNYNSYYYIAQNVKELIEYVYVFEDGRLGICTSHGNIKICKFNLA